MNRRELIMGSIALGATCLVDFAPARSQGSGIPRVQNSEPLWRWDAVDLADAIAARQISSREATMSCLERLNNENPRVNAVVEVLAEEALAAADLADRAVANGGPVGRLHGVPVTVKVNVDMRGHATTNGVVAYKNKIAAEDSSPVRNLRREGAVIFGRTNCPAFSFR